MARTGVEEEQNEGGITPLVESRPAQTLRSFRSSTKMTYWRKSFHRGATSG